ncbi:MAG TPA: spore germination protein GerW family protein [Nitrososphaerales archaeon]|nr:spore germination protein GerW family protein [Nitrososphaerales archaeon]
MSTVSDDVRTTVDELLKAISTKNVISEPIEIGDNVVITITKMGLGFGSGKGESKSATGPGGVGEGVGGAAGVSPVAIVVVHKSTSGPAGVEVKSLAPPSGVGKAIGDIATTIMQGMNEAKAKKAQEKPQ